MMLTSFDTTASLIGRRAWKVLHKTGLFALWFALTANYVGITLNEDPRQAPFALVLLAALALRVRAWWLHRSPAREPKLARY